MEEDSAWLLAHSAPTDSVAAAMDTVRLLAQYDTARSLLLAARERRESRGSHYREDYPESDPNRGKPIYLEKRDGCIRIRQ